MTTVIPPDPPVITAPTMIAVPTAVPQPLIGTAELGVTPAPLIGETILRSPVVTAADLIAAGGARQFAGACTEAIALYEQAIAMDPGFSNVYALLALCLYDQGQFDAAIAGWHEALKRDPLSPDVLAGLGTALYWQGQQELGLAYYSQALALDPRYADETFLRTESLWGASAILDSRVLRSQLLP
jgi:tetratricopeptide (TPR) repeat protein